MLTFFREITGGVTGSCGYHLFLITFRNLLIINYATTCDLTENLREIILGNHRKRMLTIFFREIAGGFTGSCGHH